MGIDFYLINYKPGEYLTTKKAKPGEYLATKKAKLEDYVSEAFGMAKRPKVIYKKVKILYTPGVRET